MKSNNTLEFAKELIYDIKNSDDAMPITVFNVDDIKVFPNRMHYINAYRFKFRNLKLVCSNYDNEYQLSIQMAGIFNIFSKVIFIQHDIIKELYDYLCCMYKRAQSENIDAYNIMESYRNA